MAGPAPTPLERKRARGNPGKRPIPKSSGTVALSRIASKVAPVGLGTVGAEFWTAALDVAGAWLSGSDAKLLQLTAEGLDRREMLKQALDREGWTVVTDKGYPYKHPLAGVLADLEKQLGQWLAQLGMNPTDRSRLGVAEVKPRGTLEILRERAGKAN